MGCRLAVWSLPPRREVIAMNYITVGDLFTYTLMLIAVITLCKKND